MSSPQSDHVPTSEERCGPPELQARLEGFRALLAPRTVAIVGASSDPSRIGGRPVRYYREGGFKGRLYPINPNRDEVQGYKAYASLAAVPEPIDCAVIAVPAPHVEGALAACAARGAAAAVVFSAGFAEVGSAGVALQRALAATAAAAGIRLVGPNCLGLFNASIGHFPTFSSFPEFGPPLPGRVGLVTQSGAYGSHVLMQARARRVGISIWASTGNEADISVADLIEALAHDPQIDVIACYLEGVKDRKTFFRGLAAAHAAKKPVVLVKVGSSSVGAAAAASHTASLAGSDSVFDAALRPFGAERVETTEELLDVVYAASRAPLPRGRRLGILTISGGAGVLMADAAEKAGLEVPALPEAVQKQLLEKNPLGSPRNPVDITAQAINDFTLVSDNLRAIVGEGGCDAMVAFFTLWPSSPVLGPKLESAIIEGTNGYRDRPLALVVLAPPRVQERYEQLGFLLFEDPSRAIMALGALARLNARLTSRTGAGLPPAVPAGAKAIPAEPLNEKGAKELLAAAGIAVLSEHLVHSGTEAAEAARVLGCPVAMKVVSPDLAHKTEAGGVILDVTSPADARIAYERIVAAVSRHAPAARIAGVLVAPMAGEGIELIVGARHDEVFGPTVMVGLGGIFVEVLRDVALRVGAVAVAEAHDMLAELKGASLLAGARGRPRLDVAAAAEAIARFSAYAQANEGRFATMEINPLLVRRDGQGAVALDALIVPARREP
jgi:acetate---CoA ligase (ADP-forming)